MPLQEKFRAQPTDIALCSLPKTGTTWLKALTFAIATRNLFGADVSSSTSPLLTALPHVYIPHMELDFVSPDYDRDKHNPYHKFPFFGTHVSYTSLPKSIQKSGCKMIYVCRNPKDTFVSMWHFYLKNNMIQEKSSFETEFERFCQGKFIYGPFWDHVLGYWKASLENPERVLFLKYEDMKKDTLFYIRTIADFLNQPFSEEEEKSGVPLKIMDLASFSNLRSLEVNKTGKYPIPGGVNLGNSTFFRKGETGDWKNHLTREMAERVDRIMKQKFDGSGLTF